MRADIGGSLVGCGRPAMLRQAASDCPSIFARVIFCAESWAGGAYVFGRVKPLLSRVACQTGVFLRLGGSLALPSVWWWCAARRESCSFEVVGCLGSPRSSAVTMPRWALLSGYQCMEWLRGGQTWAALWFCMGKVRPGRNDARDKSRSLGFSPGTNLASPLKSPVFFKGWGRAGMLGLHLG